MNTPERSSGVSARLDIHLPEENSSRIGTPRDTAATSTLHVPPLTPPTANLDGLIAAPAAVLAEPIRGVAVPVDKPQSISGPETRIPSLDGFRALSIIMVVLHHATKTALFPPHLTAALKFLINGNLGVRIFFVISGLLITSLLLKEEDDKEKISLRLFYERRVARILPVYWTYILAVFVYSLICGLIIPLRPFVEALSFSTSWFHTHEWVLEHSWSLSVEEAFYLLWPLTLTMLAYKGRVILALTVIAAGPMVRVLLYKLYGGDEYFARFSLGLLGNVDPIMWGCLLALIRHRNPALLTELGHWHPFVLHLLSAFVMLTLIHFNQPAFWHLTIPLTVTVSCLVVVYLVNYHCFISGGIGFRLLNLPWVVRIGVLSYSIYLWQQFFLQPAESHRFRWQTWPFNVPLAFLAACGSYYLLERPFLRLRARLREATRAGNGLN